MPITISSNKILIRFIMGIISIMFLYGCVEPFEPSTQFFERILVIEATLTDEVKNQEFLLSNTFEFEEDVLPPETGALVKVIDDSQTEYLFQEVSPGKYTSISAFAAQQGVTYQLLITNSDGTKFKSDMVLTPSSEPIFDLVPQRTLNDNDEDGVSINVVYAPSSNPKYFRYEYEEMYKIIAPNWTDVTLLWTSDFETIFWPKGPEGRVCYNTVTSNTIIFNSISGSDSDEALEYPIRFVNGDNYILSHRYGIRVKQFAITNEAYTYLEKLKKLSGNDNVFSQAQPGFFNGNVYPQDDKDIKVLGYFDVTSVTTKSVFFDYGDFYNEPIPDYVDDCSVIFPDPAAVRRLIEEGNVLYYSTNALGDHSVVSRVCGDCRELGGSEVPEFWIE